MEVPGELLDRRADAEEDRPRALDQAGGAHRDQALLARVLQGARVERDVERAGQVGRRAAVGLAEEAVALEAPDVAADRHLGDAELARELADVDRLLVRDPLEDHVAAIDRHEATRPPSVGRVEAARQLSIGHQYVRNLTEPTLTR